MIFNKISLDFSVVAQPWPGQLKNDWSLHRHRLRAKLGTEGESRESEREREELDSGGQCACLLCFRFSLTVFST